MLTFFKINVRIDIILQTLNETVSFLRKSQFCSGSRDIKRAPMTSSTDLHSHFENPV